MLHSLYSPVRSPSPFGPTPEPWNTEAGQDDGKRFILKPAARKIGPIVPEFSAFCTQLDELARTCHGSRILQDEVQHLLQLSDTGYDSLLKVADDTSYGLFIDCFVKDASTFARLATHAYGSHVVQLAIVLAGERKSASLKLVDCICKNVAYLSSDYLGAICLESAITLLPTSSKLLSVIAPLTSQLSTSRHGHMVVICALRNACSQTLGVMETEFAKHLESLVGNGYGFRVVIFALDMEKSGKINPKYSRVRLFIQNLKFSFHFFKLINHIILNFPSHPVVVNDLIPSIVRIVNQEKIS